MKKINNNIILDWKNKFKIVTDTAEGAVKRINPGNRVFISTGTAQPSLLVNAMVKRAGELTDVEIIQLVTIGDPPYASKELAGSFKVNSFLVSEGIRESISQGFGTYTPVMFSDIPRLITNGQISLDVSLIQVSLPDEKGFCSLGVSVDVSKTALENSKLVIAQINPNMPRTFGDSLINIYEIDVIVPVDEPILEVQRIESDDETKRICENIAALIENGSTIHLALGKIPQSTMDFLKDKKDIGIHTDMITDRFIDLVESGAVNGSRKSLDKGKIVTSFCLGTKKLYDYINNNDIFSFRRTEYVSDISVIRKQNRMVSVNTAVEIDLTGQVCADSLGTQFIAGIGGQADFIRGTNLADKGMTIIALPSTALDGTVSRIVAQLTPGAGVVTPRGDVHYVVTEYGTAYLHGKNIQERVMALISIAHPDFRAELLKKAIDYGYVESEMAKVEGKLLVSPKEVTTTMFLDDGTKIKFRPIRPTDAASMRDIVHKLIEATEHYRFDWNIKKLPQKDIEDFVYIDHRNEIAIVGTIPGTSAEEEIIAFGGYNLDKKINRAEVVLVVKDEWQGRGIGYFIIKYLARIAQNDGIRGFTSNVLTTNKSMQSVLYRLNAKVESKINGNVYSMIVDFV